MFAVLCLPVFEVTVADCSIQIWSSWAQCSSEYKSPSLQLALFSSPAPASFCFVLLHLHHSISTHPYKRYWCYWRTHLTFKVTFQLVFLVIINYSLHVAVLSSVSQVCFTCQGKQQIFVNVLFQRQYDFNDSKIVKFYKNSNCNLIWEKVPSLPLKHCGILWIIELLETLSTLRNAVYDKVFIICPLL